jgi:hypothetical protein
MIFRNKVDEALTLVIPSAATRNHNHQDLVNLMETYGVMEKAKDSFLDGEITFEEYIALGEKAEINIDNYMETIEHNLIQLKLL